MSSDVFFVDSVYSLEPILTHGTHQNPQTAQPCTSCTTLHKLHRLHTLHKLHTPVRLCICAFRPARYLDLLPISISINLTFDIKIFIKILDNGILLLYICSGTKAYHKPLTLPYITIYKYINNLKFTIMDSNYITSPAKCIVKPLILSDLTNKQLLKRIELNRLEEHVSPDSVDMNKALSVNIY